MATSTAARSIFRSCAASRSAARFAATESKAATAPRSSFRIPGPKQSSPARRCPVELSFCLESMLPYHSATATSLMTSLLFTRPYSWLSEAYNDDV